MTAVDLTPGEALVLLAPNANQGREAIKVSLMWLLAKKLLTVTPESKPGFFGRFSTTSRLHPSNRPPAGLSRELVELLHVARDAGTMDKFVKAARIRYGADLSGFQKIHLVPSLLKQRLIERRTESFLRVFSRTRYYTTHTGEVLQQRIERMFARARTIPAFLHSNPGEAAALAATLGGLIFLVPELKPHFNDIARAMRKPDYATADGGSYSGDSSSPSSSKPDEPRLDDALTLDFAGFDSATFDAFDTSMIALDSSFDAAASDCGGGGGDGGGGGGGD